MIVSDEVICDISEALMREYEECRRNGDPMGMTQAAHRLALLHGYVFQTEPTSGAYTPEFLTKAGGVNVEMH